MKENVTKRDEIRKGVSCGTEKAREQTEDMRLFIQILLESRSFYIVGS
jgi:hypothetical protein